MAEEEAVPDDDAVAVDVVAGGAGVFDEAEEEAPLPVTDGGAVDWLDFPRVVASPLAPPVDEDAVLAVDGAAVEPLAAELDVVVAAAAAAAAAAGAPEPPGVEVPGAPDPTAVVRMSSAAVSRAHMPKEYTSLGGSAVLTGNMRELHETISDIFKQSRLPPHSGER